MTDGEEYEITVRGQLDRSWCEDFGLRIDYDENGDTVLHGELADQAALHGILERVRDLNLTLLSVRRRTIEC